MKRHLTRLMTDPRTGAERRIGGRIACERLASSLGEVLDLSRSGARVLARGCSLKPGDGVLLAVRTESGETEFVEASVVRRIRRGIGRCELGLLFRSTDQPFRAKILRLAGEHAVRDAWAPLKAS